MNLPHFWRGMSWSAKAAWLCSSRNARDYRHACQILASLPRKPKSRDLRPQVVADMERRRLW